MGWDLGKNGCVLVSVTAEIHFVSVDDSYDDDDDNDASMLLQPGSRQLPRWVEELDGMRLCPLGKNGLLRDETVSSIWGTLMQEILSTLVSAARLVIMVGNFFVILCPKKKKKKKIIYTLFRQTFIYNCLGVALYLLCTCTDHLCYISLTLSPNGSTCLSNKLISNFGYPGHTQ